MNEYYSKEQLLECTKTAFQYDMYDLEDFLEEVPTADVVEVKHGEWIYDQWCEFKCSICGHWSQTEPRGKEKYCPNCGAKMDGRSGA